MAWSRASPRPAVSWRAGTKLLVLAVALLLGATARGGDDLCQKEKAAWERAMERLAKANQDLANYDNSNLAPLVPGQADAEREHLQKHVEDAYLGVKRTSDEHSECVKRKTCKSRKPGWHCVVAYTYDECCLDNKNTDKGQDKKK
jgi:hypothetical protein